ncbi:MAG TPA: hypothetical protein VGS07_03190 [Thermoanaerobaculia bacterium]|jgi:hypothetical protein|nr:hypothetical protein [Thermoanaerobaculia bacterium]
MNPFLGHWEITGWTKDTDVSKGIPANGFKVGGPLDITQIDPNVNSIDLLWLNDDDQECAALGLQYDQASNSLEKLNLTTIFAGRSIPCNFTVDLDPTDPPTLTLTINFAGETSLSSSDTEVRTRVHPTDRPDVGSGVVTAIAHPGT